MIKIRDVVNELNSIPKPPRRRIEVLMKLVYLQGKEDQMYKNKNKYKKMEDRFKKLLLRYKKLLMKP